MSKIIINGKELTETYRNLLKASYQNGEEMYNEIKKQKEKQNPNLNEKAINNVKLKMAENVFLFDHIVDNLKNGEEPSSINKQEWKDKIGKQILSAHRNTLLRRYPN